MKKYNPKNLINCAYWLLFKFISTILTKGSTDRCSTWRIAVG